MVARIARRTNPRTGQPYGEERATAIVSHAVNHPPKTRDPKLEAGRRRRLLAQLDKQLAKQGVKPPRRPATPAARTVTERHSAQQAHADALRSWGELREAVRREGGIHPNPDFAASEIPREVRARRGYGLAPDEMAQVLTARGFHFEGDDAMVQDIHRRRERVHETHEVAARVRSKTGPSVVCVDACRDERGMFERCEVAARRAARYCRRRLRDAIGRFRAESSTRR